MAAASITTEILRPVLTGMRIRGMATPEISSSSGLFPRRSKSFMRIVIFQIDSQAEPVKNP